MCDIKQQLAGTEAKDVAVAMESRDVMLPAQKALVDAILTQPGTSLQEEVSRRNRAIHAVMDYCRVEEGRMRPSQLKRPKKCVTPLATEEELQRRANERMLEEAKVSVFKERRPTICFICLG